MVLCTACTMAKDPIITHHKVVKLCFRNLGHTRHPYIVLRAGKCQRGVYLHGLLRQGSSSEGGIQTELGQKQLISKTRETEEGRAVLYIRLAQQAPEQHWWTTCPKEKKDTCGSQNDMQEAVGWKDFAEQRAAAESPTTPLLSSALAKWFKNF